MTKRGFTLFETMIAALILTIVGAGMAGVYMMEGGLVSRASHRLMAINYAKSAADFLIGEGRSNGMMMPPPFMMGMP